MNRHDYASAPAVRIRENTEWSIHYAFDYRDQDKPRVLLIGDSICNAYSSHVRARLGEAAAVSFWASSKCVTDPDYFKELDFILHYTPYRIICFNNGLHSLKTDRREWKSAYHSALDFILAACPDARLSVTLCTPLQDPERTAVSAALNALALEAADRRNLPVTDLFSLMDPLDRDAYWSDPFHFRQPAIEMQAECIAAHVLALLKT